MDRHSGAAVGGEICRSIDDTQQCVVGPHDSNAPEPARAEMMARVNAAKTTPYSSVPTDAPGNNATTASAITCGWSSCMSCEDSGTCCMRP